MKKLTLDEVAKILCTSVRTVKSYVAQGLLPLISIFENEYIDFEGLAERLGVKDFNEPFIATAEARESIAIDNLTAEVCKKKGIPFYRLKNSGGVVLLFRKSELEIWKNRYDELILEYNPTMLNDIHRDNLLRTSWYLVEYASWSIAPRERDILARFMRGKSCKEIGGEFDLTPNRIREILSKAVRRMKHTSRLLKILRGLNDVEASEWSFLEVDERVEQLKNLLEFEKKLSEREKNLSEKEADLSKREGRNNSKIRTLCNLLKDEESKKIVADFFLDRNFNPSSDIIKRKIVDCDFSYRALNALTSSGITTIGELISYTRRDLIKFNNLGEKTADEIVDYVISLGYRPGERLQ
jgi:DNA-binding CsgD family transcriptional regulator